MRVIMDYIYKDHLDATSSATFPMPLVQSLLQYLQQQLTKSIKIAEKDEQRKERKWNCFSSLDKRLQLHFLISKTPVWITRLLVVFISYP